MKPDPRIFAVLTDRYGLVPEETVFVDDQVDNVEAAGRLGFRAVRFVDAAALRDDLRGLRVLGAPEASR